MFVVLVRQMFYFYLLLHFDDLQQFCVAWEIHCTCNFNYLAVLSEERLEINAQCSRSFSTLKLQIIIKETCSGSSEQAQISEKRENENRNVKSTFPTYMGESSDVVRFVSFRCCISWSFVKIQTITEVCCFHLWINVKLCKFFHRSSIFLLRQSIIETRDPCHQSSNFMAQY